MFNDYLQAHPRSGAVAIVLIYLLAVADALLVPGAILWWLWKQPLHSGPFGVTGAVVMTIWAGKRIAHALFELDTYRTAPQCSIHSGLAARAAPRRSRPVWMVVKRRTRSAPAMRVTAAWPAARCTA